MPCFMNFNLILPKRLLISCVFSIVLSFSGSAQFTFTIATANTSKNGTKPVRLLNEVPSNAQLNQYGGNKKVKIGSSGFFQIKKVNEVWYLVDPEGNLFFTIGVNSVSKGGGLILPDVLRNIGANTLGCWSDETINDATTAKMPYCPRWNFLSNYKNTSQRTKNLYNAGIIPIFDPAYASYCDNLAKQLISSKNDPFLLGHFSDNELPLYDNTTYGNLLDRFLAITDKSDPNYLAANNWMVSRKGTGYITDSADRELFHGYVAGTYYKITGEAIKRYDPNHLYLGSRLHGAALSKSSIYKEAGKYVDIISINCYNVWTPSKSSMDMWSSGGKPFFITEFYAKAEDSGLTNESGAGWLVSTQQDRARFFENFVLALIEHPGCVGYHHFRYMDDVDSNKGLISASYKWYEPLKNSFFNIARDIYSLREFLLGKPTGMQPLKQSVPIQIFPNPTTGKIFLGSTNPSNTGNVEVFSLSGSRIRQIANADLPCIVDLVDFPDGQYIVRIVQNDSFFSKQILLTH